MKKYITVMKNDAGGEEQIKAFRLKCHEEKYPCVIVTQAGNHAHISCDNWLGTDGGLIRVEGRMMMEDRFQQLQKKYPETRIEFTTSEVKASNISNPLPLWYNFTNVPLAEAGNFADKVYAIYLAALPHGK